MEYIRLNMINKKLTPSESIIFPEGFSFRLFQHGDELNWARITHEADEFDTLEEALNYFNEQFASQKERLSDCCFFCINENGMPVGTSIAWSDEKDGTEQGMLRWVVISNKYQGRGLCRPLVALAIRKLSMEFNSAFLHTQTTSFRGIKVYLDMGFEPSETDDLSKKGWHLVWKAIKHPKLIDYGQEC